MVDSLVQNLRSTWQLYAAVVLLVGNVAAFSALPARVQAVEKRVTVLEQVTRYQACRAFLTDRGRDPKDCTDLYRYLEAFLTDPTRVP